MNSNRLYNIFKSSKLNREDIEDYKSSVNSFNKNAIEQKVNSDNFNNDAFDGWEKNDFDISLMKKMDDKFLPKNKILTLKNISLTIVFGVIIVIGFIYNQNHTVDNNTKLVAKAEDSTSKMVVEETDIILPQVIEEMENAPIHKQIKPKKIISEFAEMKLIEEKKSSTDEINKLPVKQISKEKDISIISNRKSGKEIYLNDLKIVDYKLENSHPTIKTKQILLTGTPANKEDKNSEEIDAQWKTIEIPYLDYIEKSLRILNNGNYKKALSRFETILKTYPEDINSNFYSGYCLFNLGEYNTSILYFEKSINSEYNNFDEESEWMIAQCYLLKGNKSKAKILLQKIIDRNGYYSSQAKEKISQ